MEPLFITCRNNVITRGYWTQQQEGVKLVDKPAPHGPISTTTAAVVVSEPPCRPTED
jgi:hypothetical protein